MQSYFYKLFKFNHWANNALINFLIENNIQDAAILRIASHILLAQDNWYKRITLAQQDVPVWQTLPLREIATQQRDSDQQWLDYVHRLEDQDFQVVCAYENLSRQPQQSTMEDILAHVINHATYHRGQVVYLIRELGIAPPTTDYIKFARL